MMQVQRCKRSHACTLPEAWCMLRTDGLQCWRALEGGLLEA